MEYTEKRLLGTSEKIFYLLDQITLQHFPIAVEIEGHASLADWQSALDSVQQRHHNLACKIAGNHYTNAHFEYVPDHSIPITLLKIEPDQNWPDILSYEMTKPFTLNEAPLVRVVLIERGQQTILFWISNHAIGDGLSALLAIRDLLKALSGDVITDLKPLLSFDEIVGIPLKDVLDFDNVDIADLSQPSDKIEIDVKCLSPELTQKIIEVSKYKKTTIHGILSAALIIAARQLSLSYQLNPVRILHPVSARKSLNLGDEYNLLFGSVITNTEAEENDFWQIAVNLNSKIADSQKIAFFKNGVQAIQELFYSGLEASAIVNILVENSKHEFLLSNLTKLPYNTDFGNLSIKSVFGPFVLSAHTNAQTISSITVNGRLNLTLTGRCIASNLLDMMVEKLEENTDQSLLETIK